MSEEQMGWDQELGPPPFEEQRRQSQEPAAKQSYGNRNSGGGDFQSQTPGGYDLKLVRSAIQKTIRRGQEAESLYWAQELVERFPLYLVKTLSVILSEDVGFADPAMYAAVQSNLNFMLSIQLYNKKASKDQKDKYEMGPSVATAVIMMCRMRKSRVADNGWVWALERKKAGWKLELPDVCRDEHNDAGRKLGRSWRFWCAQGMQLHPKATQEEIAGTDYEKAMTIFWSQGSEKHPNEPYFNVYNPEKPNEPIHEVTREVYLAGLNLTEEDFQK